MNEHNYGKCVHFIWLMGVIFALSLTLHNLPRQKITRLAYAKKLDEFCQHINFTTIHHVQRVENYIKLFIFSWAEI